MSKRSQWRWLVIIVAIVLGWVAWRVVIGLLGTLFVLLELSLYTGFSVLIVVSFLWLAIWLVRRMLRTEPQSQWRPARRFTREKRFLR